MAGLKELRSRIATIKSTEKITSAMKMVAASRLRRAQEVLSRNTAYRVTVNDTISRVLYALQRRAKESDIGFKLPNLCTPKADPQKYLLVVMSSDRGLCGSYNSAIIRGAIARIKELQSEGKNIQIITLGYRGYAALRKQYADLIVRHDESVVNQGVQYEEALNLVNEIVPMFETDKIDVCEVIYSKFKSALSRDVVSEQVLPFDLEKVNTGVDDMDGMREYITEPGYDEMLEVLTPLAFKEFVFGIMINSQASEQGARMTSMDNATRNAGDMIAKLTLRYNRIRQGAITTELTEIIAGAEAI